jgi:hypothetical protein
MKTNLESNKMSAYNTLLKRVNTFVANVLTDKSLSPHLSLTDRDINYLVCKGIDLSTYQSSNEESFLYSFDNNSLFEQKTIVIWSDKALVKTFEIIFIESSCKDLLDTNSESPRSRILVNKLFVHPTPPKNKLEEWIRNRKSEVVPGGFLYRYSFTQSLFNSDLDFTEEQIENALKKVTVVKIIDNQLIFYANRGLNS